MDGIPQLKGDSQCHGFNNNEECEYDGMDCCRPIITDRFCLENTCHCHIDGLYHPTFEGGTTEKKLLFFSQHYFSDSGCTANAAYVGDGICDENLNTQNCSYDFGDCCLPDKDTRFCSNCQCFEDFNWLPPES